MVKINILDTLDLKFNVAFFFSVWCTPLYEFYGPSN